MWTFEYLESERLYVIKGPHGEKRYTASLEAAEACVKAWNEKKG